MEQTPSPDKLDAIAAGWSADCEDRGRWHGEPAVLLRVSLAGAGAALLERRLHIASPPCPPLFCCCESDDEAVIIESVPANAEPMSAGRIAGLPTMELVADAIDRLHRYRLAHGSLSDSDVLASDESVWLQRVAARWTIDRLEGGASSPRQRDLHYFEGLCRRQLGEPIRSAVNDKGRTARAILDGWKAPTNDNHTPTAPRAEANDRSVVSLPRLWSDQPAASILSGNAADLATSEWQESPRRVLLLFGFILMFFLASIVYQVRSQPVSQWRLRRWLQQWIASPVDRVRTTQRASLPEGMPTDPEAVLEQLRRTHSVSLAAWLLAPADPDAQTALEKVLTEGDGSLQEFLRREFESPNSAERVLPAIRPLLARPLSDAGRRTIDRLLIVHGTKEDIAALQQLTSANNVLTRLEAHVALARLGQPMPMADIAKAYRESVEPYRTAYLQLVLMYYPYAKGRIFLKANLFEKVGAPKPLLLELAQTTPCPNMARLLEEMFGDLSNAPLDAAGPRLAPVRVLAALASIRKVRGQEPVDLIASLAIRDPVREQIRQDVVRAIFEPGDEPSSQPVEDVWLSAASQWADAVPADYFERMFKFMPHLVELDSVSGQSRFLALIDAQAGVARLQVGRELASSFRDSLCEERPVECAAIITAVAATLGRESEEFVAEFFGESFTLRDPVFWEAWVNGLTITFPRERPTDPSALLTLAALHPVPGVSLRANECIALARHDWSALRTAAPALIERGSDLSQLIHRIGQATSAQEVQMLMTRQKDPALIDLALARSSSPGCLEILRRRIEERERPWQTLYLRANNPEPFNAGVIEQFFARRNDRRIEEQAILISFGLHRDSRFIEQVRPLALGSANAVLVRPNYHRFLAVRTLGDLRQEPPASYAPVILHSPSRLVRHAAAVALLKSDGPISDELAKAIGANSSLDPEIVRCLELARDR